LNGETERAVFYEGATWMAKQTVQKCDQSVESVKDLRESYQVRQKECEDNAFLKTRNAQWLMDSTERLCRETRNQVNQLLEGALRNKQ
jgi:hypothetical protein